MPNNVLHVSVGLTACISVLEDSNYFTNYTAFPLIRCIPIWRGCKNTVQIPGSRETHNVDTGETL